MRSLALENIILSALIDCDRIYYTYLVTAAYLSDTGLDHSVDPVAILNILSQTKFEHQVRRP